MRRFVSRHPNLAALSGLALFVFAAVAMPAVLRTGPGLFVAYLVAGAVVGYAAGVARPHGAFARLAMPLTRGGVVLFVVVMAIGWPPYRVVESEGLHWYAVLAVQLTAMVSLAVGTVRRRRSPRTHERGEFSLADYLIVTGIVVVMHWVLAIVVAADDNLLTWSGAFVYSQVSTGLALRSLHTALVHDWRLPGSRLSERARIFLLAIVPVALCLLPSISAGALLAGVIMRLVLLIAVWAFTDLPPEGTWKTLKRLRVRRAHRPPSDARPAGAAAMVGAEAN